MFYYLSAYIFLLLLLLPFSLSIFHSKCLARIFAAAAISALFLFRLGLCLQRTLARLFHLLGLLVNGHRYSYSKLCHLFYFVIYYKLLFNSCQYPLFAVFSFLYALLILISLSLAHCLFLFGEVFLSSQAMYYRSRSDHPISSA